MKRLAFVLPYFGHFNNYFQLYLYTCGHNADLCDWLIFTDDHTKYNYPDNVKVHYISWDEMVDLLIKKMSAVGCNAKIDEPYKLCDYKAVYGYIFSEYLKDYDFWGECDCDLIWGHISDFITDELLDQYEKFFDLGHCTLYQNVPETNMLFQKKLDGVERYKCIFENGRCQHFDEEYVGSINNIALEHGIRMYNRSFAANTYTKSSNFRLTTLASDKSHYETEKKSDSVFVWEQGHLNRYTKTNYKIRKDSFMYMHFQARHMDVNISIESCPEVFKIIPNAFDELEVEIINDDTIDKIKKKHFNLHYFRLRSKNLITKIRSRLG